MYTELAKMYSKNESSMCEIVKKEKKNYTTFAAPPQTAKNMPQWGKCLVKVEKALHL